MRRCGVSTVWVMLALCVTFVLVWTGVVLVLRSMTGSIAPPGRGVAALGQLDGADDRQFWEGRVNTDRVIAELTSRGEGIAFVNRKGQVAWALMPADEHPLVTHAVADKLSPTVAALGEHRVFVAIALPQGGRLTMAQARNALQDALNRKTYAQLRTENAKHMDAILNMKPIDFSKE